MSSRKVLSKHDTTPIELEAPNLVQIQLDSYKWFLEKGFKELLKDVSTIEDWTGKELELSFTDFKIDEPKYGERKSLETLFFGS